MKRITAAELLADAERRTVRGIMPTLVDVVIEKETHENSDYYVVYAVWSGVDRPRGVGVSARTKRLAERLERAVRAGVAIGVDRVMRDVNGKTYVQEHRTVLSRTLGADLKRLGF